MDPPLTILANVLLFGILCVVSHTAHVGTVNLCQILKRVCPEGSGSDAALPWFLLQ